MQQGHLLLLCGISRNRFQPNEKSSGGKRFSNVRRTCERPVPKDGKTTSYRGEEMPKALFSHLHGSPRASKRKNKTKAETPDGKTYKKSHAERHGISSIEKKAPKTKGSILSDSRHARIHYSRPLPSRPANTPFSSARK